MRLKPAEWVGFPLLLLVIIPLGFALTKDDGEWAKWAIPPFILMAIVFVMSPQINWWWYRKNPPEPTAGELNIVKRMPFYVALSSENKAIFRKRLALFCIGNDFMRPAPPNEDNRVRRDVPADLKGIIAASAVQLTFGFEPQDSAMLGKFENFIVYPHPFISPQIQNIYHTSELFEPDGVLIFAADELTQGATQPQHFFNIGLYEIARAFQLEKKDLVFPQLKLPETYTELANVGWGGFEAAASLNHLQPDAFGIAVVNFFAFPEKMKQHMPDLFQLLQNLLRQNPINAQQPRIPS